MKILSIPCAFDNFAYLVMCEETMVGAVVDPTEAYPVWQEAERVGVKLRTVLCTHHHHDHTGGIEDLLGEQRDLEIYGYHGDAGRIHGLTHPLDDGDELKIGNLRGRVLHTPGHTTGSLCYYFGSALFTGDTLFGAGCGRLFEGTAEEMYNSLNGKIASLPEETLLYFGHEYTRQNLLFAQLLEPDNQAIRNRLVQVTGKMADHRPSSPSTLYEEKRTNPFLRCHDRRVRNNFIMAGSSAADAEIFALLRQRRDAF